MSNVKNAVDRHTNTDLSIIPGVFTSLVQLADVNWKKKHSRKLTRSGTLSGWQLRIRATYSPAGNICAPSKLLCLQWDRILFPRRWQNGLLFLVAYQSMLMEVKTMKSIGSRRKE